MPGIAGSIGSGLEPASLTVLAAKQPFAKAAQQMGTIPIAPSAGSGSGRTAFGQPDAI